MTLTNGYSEEVNWSRSCVEVSSRSHKSTGPKRTGRHATLGLGNATTTTEGLARPMGAPAREFAGGRWSCPSRGERHHGRAANAGRRYAGPGRGPTPGATGATDGDSITWSAPAGARPRP